MRVPAPPHSESSPEFKAPSVAAWAIAVIAVATTLRLVLAAFLPVTVDEAYSIGMARQLSLSYFDHPPLHLWLVGLWAKLWGSEDLLLLRLPFVALSALSGWLMFRLSSRLFDARAGLWAVIAFNLAPIYGIAHGTLILPDGPLLAAALATALLVAGIMFEPKAGGMGRTWALAGFCAGLALLSKYHGVLLVAGLFLFLATTRTGRGWLVRPGPWIALGVALACLAPVLAWNAEHGWASFLFQSGRSRLGAAIEPLGPLQSLVMQMAYLMPWIAVPLAVVLVRALIGGPGNERRWLSVSLTILPVAVFTALTLFGRGLPHWQMPGWLFALPLLGEALAGAGRAIRRVAAGVAGASAVLIVAFAGVGTAQARWGSFDQPVVAMLGSDPTVMLQPWDELKPAVAARGLPADGRSFIAAFHWIRAAQLNTVFGKEVPVLCICGNDGRGFAYLHPPAEFAGWTAILIDAPAVIGNDEYLGTMFESLAPPADVTLSKNGRPTIPLALRVATGFAPQGR